MIDILDALHFRHMTFQASLCVVSHENGWGFGSLLLQHADLKRGVSPSQAIREFGNSYQDSGLRMPDKGQPEEDDHDNRSLMMTFRWLSLILEGSGDCKHVD